MNNLHLVKTITREDKEHILNTKSKVIWLYGLSGSGKSTIALSLEKYFLDNNIISKILDGDNLRLSINGDLDFTIEGRYENIRRTAEIAKMFLDCGIVTIVSLITPTNELRKLAKDIIGEDDFIEIFVNTPLDVCIKRNPKGLYSKNIKNFTGVSSTFENPTLCDLEINTEILDIEEETKIIYNFYVRRTNN